MYSSKRDLQFLRRHLRHALKQKQEAAAFLRNVDAEITNLETRILILRSNVDPMKEQLRISSAKIIEYENKIEKAEGKLEKARRMEKIKIAIYKLRKEEIQ